MDIDTNSELATVLHDLDEIEARSPDDAGVERVAAGVSNWSVGQQLHHAAIVAQSIASAIRALLRGRGQEGEATSDQARLILEAGAFPRGVGQAPAPMLPDDSPDAATVRAALDRARSRWSCLVESGAEIEACPARLPHPMLGPLTAAEWLRFAAIHGRHHLTIVDEILAV